MDAFDLGLHSAQRPPVFYRRQQLRVERFLGGDASRQKNVDDRLSLGLAPRGLRLQLEQIAEGQPDAAHHPHEQELPTVWPPDVLRATTPKTWSFHKHY